jgi:hypothetical protein
MLNLAGDLRLRQVGQELLEQDIGGADLAARKRDLPSMWSYSQSCPVSVVLSAAEHVGSEKGGAG